MNSVLRAIGGQLEVHLELDSSGRLELQLADDVVCILEVPEYRSDVLIHATICPTSSICSERSHAMALKLNWSGLGRSGSWIALDDVADALVLCLVSDVRNFFESGVLENYFVELHSEVLNLRRVFVFPQANSASCSQPPALVEGSSIRI